MKKELIISFDIYDTLIERIVPAEKIYKLISIKYNIPTFIEDRLNAEKIAKKWNKNYTIYDIYKYMNIKQREKILQEEIELEIKNAKKNILGEKIYKNFEKDNYLICISDMYFPKEIIEKILLKNGYNEIKKIYISCDYKASKRNRKLFKIVKKDFNNKKIIHIGDSIRSDCFNAIISGYKTTFINKNQKNNYAKKLTKNEYLEKIGYYIFGPLVFEFCLWLKDKKRNNMLFLSREGDMLCNCYNKIFKEKQKILYISRKSVLSGILYSIIEEEQLDIFLKKIIKSRKENVNDLLNRINLLKARHLFSNELLKANINEKNINKIISLIYQNKMEILQLLKEDHIIFESYLNSIIKSNVSIVDVGWNGSMQDLLNFYLKKKKIDIDGYYIGCLEENKKNGFLFNNICNVGLTVLNYSGILEIIFMPEYGSIIGYKNNNNNVIPIHDKYEFTQDDKNIINLLQKGYMNYIEDRKKLGLYQLYDKFEIIDIINKLGLYPNKYDINYLGNIKFYDNGKIEKLVNLKGKIINNFKRSEWKIAFLKKIFKISFPYNNLLLLIRRNIKK